MNPYLSFSIAMCGVIFVALAGTTYLAVYFNRRAKEDLERALKPLAEFLAGEVDVEEATVTGRYQGHIAEGRVAALPGGMGRFFQISLIDGAGGAPWEWTVTRSREPGGVDSATFKQDVPGVTDRIDEHLQSMKTDSGLAGFWFRVEYDPAQGHIRLTRPMRTRRDIPQVSAFTRFLDYLYEIAGFNWSIQGPQRGGG